MVAIAHLLANRLPVITMVSSPSWVEHLSRWCAVHWHAFLEWCNFPLLSTNLAKHTDIAPEIFTPSSLAGLSHSVSSSSSFSIDASDRLVSPLACAALNHLYAVRWPKLAIFRCSREMYLLGNPTGNLRFGRGFFILCHRLSGGIRKPQSYTIVWWQRGWRELTDPLSSAFQTLPV